MKTAIRNNATFPSPFTGKDPRKGWRVQLNYINCNEQRDRETGFGYFGARYGSRADDDVAQRRPDGGQVPEPFAVCLLCVESSEAGGSGRERIQRKNGRIC